MSNELGLQASSFSPLVGEEETLRAIPLEDREGLSNRVSPSPEIPFYSPCSPAMIARARSRSRDGPLNLDFRTSPHFSDAESSVDSRLQNIYDPPDRQWSDTKSINSYEPYEPGTEIMEAPTNPESPTPEPRATSFSPLSAEDSKWATPKPISSEDEEASTTKAVCPSEPTISEESDESSAISIDAELPNVWFSRSGRNQSARPCNSKTIRILQDQLKTILESGHVPGTEMIEHHVNTNGFLPVHLLIDQLQRYTDARVNAGLPTYQPPTFSSDLSPDTPIASIESDAALGSSSLTQPHGTKRRGDQSQPRPPAKKTRLHAVIESEILERPDDDPASAAEDKRKDTTDEESGSEWENNLSTSDDE